MMIEYKKEYEPFLDKLANLYREMELAYIKSASIYDFKCRGCDDNCCKTYFCHHTLIEYLYIIKGYKNIQSGLKNKIKEKIPNKEICPLNFKGLCVLYEFRPMICRLHGIPHIFIRPDGIKVRGEGCEEFYKSIKKKNIKLNRENVLDRTPFYKEMAALEKAVRKYSKIDLKIKMTIAEMISSVYISDSPLNPPSMRGGKDGVSCQGEQKL